MHRVREMSPSSRWHDTMKSPCVVPRSDDVWTWVVASGSKANLCLDPEVSSHMGAGALGVGHWRCLASGIEEEHASRRRNSATMLKENMHHVGIIVLELQSCLWRWERWDAKLDRRMNLRYHVTSAGSKPRQTKSAPSTGFVVGLATLHGLH